MQNLAESRSFSASSRSAACSAFSGVSAPDISVPETGVTACFSIRASAEPSVMPRVLELFAKRGLIPARWHSDIGGRRRDELTIDLQVRGLTAGQRDHVAACLRAMVSVTSVLIAEKHYR